MHVRYIRRSLILSLVVLLLVEVYRIHQLSVSFFVFVMYLLRIYCKVYCSFFVLPAFIVLAVSIMPNVCIMFPDPCFFAVSRRPQLEDSRIRGSCIIVFIIQSRQKMSPGSKTTRKKEKEPSPFFITNIESINHHD